MFLAWCFRAASYDTQEGYSGRQHWKRLVMGNSGEQIREGGHIRGGHGAQAIGKREGGYDCTERPKPKWRRKFHCFAVQGSSTQRSGFQCSCNSKAAVSSSVEAGAFDTSWQPAVVVSCGGCLGLERPRSCKHLKMVEDTF